MTDIRLGYWVRFRADGVPDWWGGAWIEGAEWIEGRSEDQLCTLRRVDGKWVERAPEAERKPEREAELAALAAEEAVAAPEPVDIKAELAALIDTVAAIADRVAELQAAVEAQE